MYTKWQETAPNDSQKRGTTQATCGNKIAITQYHRL